MKFTNRLCQESQTNFVLGEGSFSDFRPAGLPSPAHALILSGNTLHDMSITNLDETNEFFLPGLVDAIMVEFKEGANQDLSIEGLTHYFKKYLLDNAHEFLECDTDGLFAFWPSSEGFIVLACDAGGSNIAQYALEDLEHHSSSLSKEGFSPINNNNNNDNDNEGLIFHRFLSKAHFDSDLFFNDEYIEGNDLNNDVSFCESRDLLLSLFEANPVPEESPEKTPHSSRRP